MKLTEQEKRVLRICNEEPGSSIAIAKALYLPICEVEKILAKLCSHDLMYFIKEIKGGLWSTTLLGSQTL